MFFEKRAQNLTLILLTWRIWWAPNNASKWQMGFNSAFKGLNTLQNNLASWDLQMGFNSVFIGLTWCSHTWREIKQWVVMHLLLK